VNSEERIGTPEVDFSKSSFLGWRVVGAAFIAQFLTVTVTFAAFGNFVVPLATEFDISRGEIGRGVSIAILSMGLAGPLVGSWVDRGYIKQLFIIGLVVSASGLVAMSQIPQLWLIAAVYGLVVSIGACCFGQLPSMALVTNWFDRRRGLGMGIAVAGATLATMIVPPAAALLIEAYGWRMTLVVFAGAALAIGLPIFATSVIARPELVGQLPDGEQAEDTPEENDSPEAEELVKTGELVRELRLWLLALGFGLVFTSPIVIIVSLVPFGEDLGFSSLNAAAFFTVAGPFSILGKVVFGAVADRVPAHPAVWIVVILNLAVWLLLATEPNYGFFLTIAALYGLGIGSTGPLHGVVMARCYGRVAFGRAMGIGGIAGLPLVAGAPLVSGLVLDASGYTAVFLMMSGLLFLGGVLISFVHIPRS